jgi:outer membrane protein OmpA-like peptidoglycan-associated protein
VYEKLEGGATAINTGSEEENDMLIRYNQGKLINNLFYAHNIYKLSNDNKEKMDQIVTFLNNNKEAKIIVSSHASLIGSDEYNDQLSKRRMMEVVDYLLEAGISEDRFEGKYYGEDNPLVDCTKQDCDESDLRQNRRTEISIVK